MFVSRQSVETDETAKKPELMKTPVNSEEEREAITHLGEAISSGGVASGGPDVAPVGRLLHATSRPPITASFPVQRGCR